MLRVTFCTNSHSRTMLRVCYVCVPCWCFHSEADLKLCDQYQVTKTLKAELYFYLQGFGEKTRTLSIGLPSFHFSVHRLRYFSQQIGTLSCCNYGDIRVDGNVLCVMVFREWEMCCLTLRQQQQKQKKLVGKWVFSLNFVDGCSQNCTILYQCTKTKYLQQKFVKQRLE